jgi:hypothetical protein
MKLAHVIQLFKGRAPTARDTQQVKAAACMPSGGTCLEPNIEPTPLLISPLQMTTCFSCLHNAWGFDSLRWEVCGMTWIVCKVSWSVYPNGVVPC